MVNRKRKSLVTIVLVVGLMLSSISMVFAALETFLVQGNDGCYYEYNSSDLDMSYLTYQINPNLPGATMYKHFISVGGKVVGVKDSDKGYMDFQAAQDASLRAQIKGQVFNINDYLATDNAKPLGGDITGIKEVDQEGNVIEPNGLPKATVKFYASLVPGMKTIMVTLDTETPLDYTVTYDGQELTYNEILGSFKAEMSTTISETLKPVITKTANSNANVQFYASLTPGMKVVMVTLDVENPLDYRVTYDGTELIYDAVFGAFCGEVGINVSESLEPVISNNELPDATTQFYTSLTPNIKIVLVTLDTESPLEYKVSYAGVELVYEPAFGGFLGDLATNVSETLKPVITKIGNSESNVSFYPSLTPGMKTVLVTLDVENPLNYQVTYDGIELNYDADFGAFYGEVGVNVSESLKPVITKNELPAATTQFFASLTPGKITILVTLDTVSPLDYTVSYGGVELLYDADFGGFFGELDTGVSETLVPVVVKL